MSLFRPQATKVFHQISRLQPEAPISVAANNQKHAPKPPDHYHPSKKSTRPARPTFNTKRSTPASRQSRQSRRGRAHLDAGLNVFGVTLPAPAPAPNIPSSAPNDPFSAPNVLLPAPNIYLPAPSLHLGPAVVPLNATPTKFAETSRWQPNASPFIGVSSRLRIRPLMTPMTPSTPLNTTVTQARTQPPLMPTVGVSSRLRTRRLMTPMTPMTPMTTVRTMVTQAKTKPNLLTPAVGVTPRLQTRSFMTTTPVVEAIASEPTTSKGQRTVACFNPRTRMLASSLTPMTMTGAVAGPSTSTFPFSVQTRNYRLELDCTEMNMRKRPPCFSVKKQRPKEPPIEWTSPCACDAQKANRNRCLLWKCRSSFCECPRPTNFLKVYKCPIRIRKPRMRQLAVKKRKLRLGYKLCVPPKLPQPFSCVPKRAPPPPPPEPTPKRCPCFKPPEAALEHPCKKMRCAVHTTCKSQPRMLNATCPCKTSVKVPGTTNCSDFEDPSAMESARSFGELPLPESKPLPCQKTGYSESDCQKNPLSKEVSRPCKTTQKDPCKKIC